MRIVHVGLLMLLAVPLACASPAAAQQNQKDDLAAAARKTREQQKERPKPGKVWDNDTIPKQGGVDVVGPSAAPAAAPAKSEKPSTKESAEAATNKAEKKSDLEAELKSAKDELKTLQEDLDIAQRKYALDQQSFYQNPNYSSDAAGAAALKDEENQIQSKKDAVEAAQKKVADLEAKIKAAGNGSENSESK